MNFHALLDLLTIKVATLSKFRFFSNSIESPSFTEHLAAIEFDMPIIQGEGYYEITTKSLVGPLDPAFHIAQWRGSEFPILIFHHGNNERPFDYGATSKNTFKNIFLVKKEEISANLIAIRAPYHRSLKDYTREMTHLSNFLAMLAVSTTLVDSLVQLAHERLISPIVVSGISLGGWVTNLHRAYFGSADAYVPMLAGAALEDVFLESAYQSLSGENARQNPETVKQALNFELQFLQAPEANVFPLLARHDQIIRLERQRLSYAKHPLTIVNKGHVTAALASERLRGHVLKRLINPRDQF
jgi:hypothetical protein